MSGHRPFLHRLVPPAACLAVLLIAAPCRAALVVSHLRCDWGANPVGVDSAAPRLSWQLASVTRSARQIAWQVQAASSLAALRGGRADLWDSGRVASNAQFDVPYRGRALHTGERVFWRARAWDASGRPSPWSGVGTWTMGVMRPADWVAHWITDPELLKLSRTKLGFSTPPVTNPDTPEWITLDLGASYPITAINLDAIVHSAPQALGFPRWFKVELANEPDFAHATVVADHTQRAINPWLTRLRIPVANLTARYVRIYAPKLRMTAEEGKPAPVGRLALRQIEVIANGRDVAIGAHVTASASLETRRWSAAAVVDGKEIPGANPRAADTLLVRREFDARAGIRRATLFVTGLGTYTLAINGTPVGAPDFFKPGWTTTARTCLYNTFDVTADIRRGRNAIGLTLAGGMYNVPEVPGHYTKFVSAPRPLVALAQLRIEYRDGRVETIATNSRWKVAAGPTTFAQVYGGEDYDARRNPAGWDRPGFDDSGWRAAVTAPAPGGALRGYSEAAPPVRAEATLPVLHTQVLRPGVTVYDLGQNAALLPRLEVRGVAGSTVRIIPAELLKADGSINPASTRPGHQDASWRYTLGGTGRTETWQPEFFYHGARYLEVVCTAPAGSPLPVVEQLEGIAVHSDSAPVGHFRCSDVLFNRIDRLVRWAQANNLVSIITDCPHRERLGWLEQDHLNGPSIRYDFNATRLYAKVLDDIADAQRPTGLVPDIAPEYVQFSGPFRDSPEWGSAFIIAAWQQFVWTGDAEPLRRHFAGMKRYFAYLTSRAQDHLLNYGLGDWYDLGPRGPGVAQLTPIPLTASAVYYQDAVALERIARRLDRPADAARFRRAAAAIARAFNARFYDPATKSYATGSQTSNAMPLALGLVPPADRAAVAAHLVQDVRAHGNTLTSGDVGYRYLLRALAGAGRSDVVFAMNNQCAKPGYGYQLARGATSLTEAWDANPHSSQDHLMLGQIIEWFYGDLAGLAPDPAVPGFGRVIVRPNPVGDIRWVRASYDSVRGPVAVHWRRTGRRFVLDVTVPANATARVEIPAAPGAPITEGGVPAAQADGVAAEAPVDGRPTFALGAGRYEFATELPVAAP